MSDEEFYEDLRKTVIEDARELGIDEKSSVPYAEAVIIRFKKLRKEIEGKENIEDIVRYILRELVLVRAQVDIQHMAIESLIQNTGT